MEKNASHEALNQFLEKNKQPTKKYGFKALLAKHGPGSPRAESAGPSPAQSGANKLVAESMGALPPLKHVNNEQEDEILNLIQKNLLYDKGNKNKKQARGDFAKKYVSVDKTDQAPERYQSSQLVKEAEVHNAKIQAAKIPKPGTQGAQRGHSVGPKYSETRAQKDDMLS